MPLYSGATPTKTATAQYSYSFNGSWSPAIVAVTGAATYTAQFDRSVNSYTVSFNVQGHGIAPASQTIEYGSKVTKPVDPSETGCTFGGWYKESVCVNAWNFNSNTVTGVTELFAKWTLNQWNLSWNANGGVLSGNYTSGLVNYGAAITAPTATRTGYDFAGWDNEVPATMPDNALSFTAQWNIHTYNNLTFTSEDENKGTVSVEGEKATYTYGDQVTITATANEGYTFTDWSDGNSSAERNITIDDNTQSLVAQFSANTNTAYTVKHWLQNILDNDYTLDSEQQLTGTTATQTAAVARDITGFDALSFSQATIAGNGSTVVDIYYDRKVFAVAFKVGDEIVKSDNLRYGATPAAPATPTKEADAQYTYTFSGWSPAIAAVTEAVTYIAQFNSQLRSYAVSFNVQGHGNAPAGQTVTYGGKVTKPADLNIEGYTFGGWYKEAACQNAWNFESDVVEGALELFAKWTINSWTITWNANGGSITSSNHTAGTVVYGTAIVAATAERTGFNFAGWEPQVPETMPDNDLSFVATWVEKGDIAYRVEHYTENLDGSWKLADTDNLTGATNASVTPAVKNYTGFTAPATQTRSILADGSLVIRYEYTRNSYTLSFILDGGQIAGEYSQGTLKFEAPITAPADPTKTGSTFHGWDKQIPQTMPAQNLEITAQWTLNSYDGVTFEAGEGGTINVNPQQSTYNYGDEVTLTATPDDGYSFNGWVDGNGSTVSGNASITYTVEGDATITAQFSANTNTPYIVRHLQEQLNGEFEKTSEDEKQGTTGEQTQAAANTYEGFTAQAFEQQAIAGNGSTVVEIRYTRNSYLLTWDADGGQLAGGTPGGNVKYGAAIVEPTATKTGHTFIGWDNEVPQTMPAQAVTLKALWEADTYSGIEFKSEDENKGTVSVEGEKATYTYGDQVTITAEANDGYTFTGWSDGNTDSERNITIDGNTGSLTAQFSANANTPYKVRHLLQNADTSTLRKKRICRALPIRR